MNIDAIQQAVRQRTWYHKIDLGNGIVTPGFDFDSIWNLIRDVRGGESYVGKRVLDLGTWDGMWAFEAEKMSAEFVTAVDCDSRAENFFFCREILKSKIIPYFNISPYNLVERLNAVLNPIGTSPKNRDSYLFDIVQHLGMLYHLTDPLASLFQTRLVMKTGGKLLLETAGIVDTERSFMLFNGRPGSKEWPRIYNDVTTWWAPTSLCLYEMLESALFKVHLDSVRYLDSPGQITRIALIAEAIAPQDAHPMHMEELYNSYRLPNVDFMNVK